MVLCLRTETLHWAKVLLYLKSQHLTNRRFSVFFTYQPSQRNDINPISPSLLPEVIKIECCPVGHQAHAFPRPGEAAGRRNPGFQKGLCERPVSRLHGGLCFILSSASGLCLLPETPDSMHSTKSVILILLAELHPNPRPLLPPASVSTIPHP